MSDHRSYLLYHWVTDRRYRGDRWFGVCTIGVCLIGVAWWSSFQQLSGLTLARIDHFTVGVAQLCGRIKLIAIHSPTGHHDLFTQIPVTPWMRGRDEPLFAVQDFVLLLPVPGGGWSGAEISFPHGLLFLAFAIYPAWRLPGILLRLARSVEPNSFRLRPDAESFRIRQRPESRQSTTGHDLQIPP